MSHRRPFCLSHAACIATTLLIGLACAKPALAQMQVPRAPIPNNAELTYEKVRGPQSPAIGARDAPVTIVVFSDYYCPYCRTLSATLELLLEKYPRQVRIVYRHLAMSSATRQLSQAALCASEQGRFSEYHRRIFSTHGVGPDHIAALAAAVDLDAEVLLKCVQSDRYRRRVEADIREGDRLGVQVTPTLFVNGQRISGSTSLETLSARVEQALR